MPNYIKKPEPARFIKKERIVEKVVKNPVAKPEGLDINALANAVANAICLNIPQQVVQVGRTEKEKSKDAFDNSKTMSRLADQMLVQRGVSKANFDDLGSVKKTKKDQKDVDNTIDLLRNLND